MSLLSQTIIIGSWQVARAELPPTSPSPDPAEERFLHFTADWRHFWEHPFTKTPELRRAFEFRYRMTEHGVFITPYNQRTARLVDKGWELPFTSDGELLVFSSPKTSMRWWLHRILPSERPEFLTHYYAPPEG